MRYENEICPVCKNAFRSGDDIVVCPSAERRITVNAGTKITAAAIQHTTQRAFCGSPSMLLSLLTVMSLTLTGSLAESAPFAAQTARRKWMSVPFAQTLFQIVRGRAGWRPHSLYASV
jgi:hypothetical protein